MIDLGIIVLWLSQFWFFCTPEEHEIFMEDIVNFEQDLVRQGMILIKLYFSVSKEEQKEDLIEE